jgi:hypothetical protein
MDEALVTMLIWLHTRIIVDGFYMKKPLYSFWDLFANASSMASHRRRGAKRISVVEGWAEMPPVGKLHPPPKGLEWDSI